MVGVLNSQFGVYDDTIPLPGGGGQDDYFSGADVVPLPGGADDFYFNPPDIGDYQPEAGAAPAAAPRGPLAQAGASMPTPSQQSDVVQGPLAASAPQNLQMSLIDAAQQRIMDYRRQQDAAKAGQVNLPLLAAAGALLSPTRTGSLGESIGNAFSAAAPAVQRQRQMDMQEAQARAKEDWNMAYQQAVLQDRGQWRNIQQQNVDRQTAEANRRFDIMQQRADNSLDAWRPTGQVDDNGNPVLANGRGELRVDTSVKVGAKPSSTGDWRNTGKVDDNGNPIQINHRTGEYRVDTSVKVGATPGSGSNSSNNIIAQNARTIAQAEIAKREAAGEELSPEEKARVENKHITDALLARSPFMHGINPLKRDVLDNWITADPTILEDPTRFAILNSKINGGMIIKPQQAFAIEERAQQTKNAIEALQRVRKGISDYAGAAGGVGKAFGAGETIANIVARMKNTGYADVTSDLALARNLIPTLLTAKGTAPQSAHAISELQKIVRGGNWGDTYQNVMSNSEKMIKLLGGDLKHLDDFYQNGLGIHLSVFAAPGEDRKPFSAPRSGPNGAAPPQPGAPRRTPQQTAPDETTGFTPDVGMLKAGKVTRFDDGSAWTVVNGKAVKVQ